MERGDLNPQSPQVGEQLSQTSRPGTYPGPEHLQQEQRKKKSSVSKQVRDTELLDSETVEYTPDFTKQPNPNF